MKVRWLLHPLFIFIFSLLALGGSLFIYIRSYLKVNDAFTKFVRTRGLDASQFLDSETWVTVLVLSVLIAIIVLGMVIVFIYYQKTIQLYQMQQNFINGFTHELKTPIASMKLYIDTFLKHDIPREKQLKYLNYMVKDTDRLSSNVNQILTLGRIEERRFKGEMEVVDLEILIRNYIQRNDHVYADGEISFSNQTKSGDTSILCNTPLVESLISNLLENAIHHSKHESEPQVKVQLKSINNHLQLSVTDNGTGISRQELKKIFKKFYQIGKGSKGSGLGLYFCSQIMKIHGGAIKAFSSGLGMGSTFNLSFPLAVKEFEDA